MRTKHFHADRRFLVRTLGAAGDEAVLDADEAHHLSRVLRLGPGDHVAVFDGRGREFLARVSHAGRTRATVTLVDPIVPAAEPRVPFAIAQAILKGSAMDDAVRDATMIGASKCSPKRSSVCSKRLRFPSNGSRCLGRDVVDNGQRRVPAPPANITGRIGRRSTESIINITMRANDCPAPAFIFPL